MPENSAIARVVQLGPETTAGTSVAATKKLSSVDLMGKLEANVVSFTAAGSKYPTVHSLGKEWSSWKVQSEAPCFDELHYLLCSLVKNVTPTTSDTSARTWTFAPTPDAEDTRKTFTIEEGHSGSNNAHKSSFGVITGLKLSIDRDGTKLDGSGVARVMSTATLTGGTAVLPTVPILARDWSVFLDTTSGALGTTRLSRVLKVDVSFEDLTVPFWTVDQSQASWAGIVEQAPKCSVQLTMEADSTSMAYQSLMQAGTTRYMRLRNTSTTTLAGATSVYYGMTIDIAGQISEVQDFGTDQELYTIGWTFEPTTDSAWGTGKPFEISVINKQGTL